MIRKLSAFIFLSIISFSVMAQTGIIKGKISNRINKEPIPFASIIIDGTDIGTTTDINGNFEFLNLKPGLYNLKTTYIGFQPVTIFEVAVTNAKATFVNIEMDETTKQLAEAVVSVSPFIRSEESPLSLRTLSEQEIKRNPGANRDISKVLQSLPGVASTASFRNDIIVRGGSPNENRFYLDGIEVPTINHFATQGASGGPVGLINVDFVQSLDFYAGAFPDNRGNALSSVLDFKFKDARRDKPAYSITLGASDLGITIETPLTKKSTLIASWRRSYLQFLFQALELPFLPKYDDFQFKSTYEVNEKNIIEVIGLGAIDRVTLNTSANESDLQQYILGYIPESNQWNYTIGGSYRHFKEHSYTTFVLSRNMLNNTSTKYLNNDENSDLIQNYNSVEAENKLRIENTIRKKDWKINYGAGGEYALYTTSTFQILANNITLNYDSKINVLKYSAFGSVSKTLLNDRLSLSLGLRFDGSDFNSTMANLFNQYSPRFSLSYNITQKLTFNFNTGIYRQLPAYTVLGYRDSIGLLINENVKYMSNNQVVAGFEYSTSKNSRLSIEGFYKQYYNYPFDLRDSISLANEGSDFGVIGNTPVESNNKGRAYGVELLFQQKLFRNFYGLLSYTFVRSEFQNLQGKYIPASWDYQNILSLTAGKIFKRNWEAGLKFRYNSSAPYTPYNVPQSMYKSNWDVTQQGIADYSQLNTKRTGSFYQIDIRIDKKYNFKKWSLNLYLDIQNVTNSKTTLQPYLSVERDAQGNPLVDSDNPNYYIPKSIANESGTIVPTFGVIVEF